MRSTMAAPSRALEVVGYIEELIEDACLQPGDKIATKDQIREGSGAARATVNEAVKVLHERGRIVMRPGPKGGLFVVAANPGIQLGRFLLAVGDDAKSVADAMALRDFLEEMVITEAVEHHTAQDVADLRELLRQIEADRDQTELLVIGIWELHLRIAQITPNATLKATYGGLVDFIRSRVAGQPTSRHPERGGFTQKRVDIHAELVDVIEAGDTSLVRDAVHRHNHI